LKIVTEAVELGHAPRILMYGRDAADHPLLRKAIERQPEIPAAGPGGAESRRPGAGSRSTLKSSSRIARSSHGDGRGLFSNVRINPANRPGPNCARPQCRSSIFGTS